MSGIAANCNNIHNAITVTTRPGLYEDERPCTEEAVQDPLLNSRIPRLIPEPKPEVLNDLEMGRLHKDGLGSVNMQATRTATIRAIGRPVLTSSGQRRLVMERCTKFGQR